MENPKFVLINFLKRLQKRNFKHTLFLKVTQSLFYGLCLLVPLSIVVRFVLFPYAFTYLSISIGVGAMLLCVYIYYKYRLPLTDIARFVDAHLQLKERVSTSLELIHNNRQDEFAQLQINETAESILNADPAKVLPYILPPYLKWLPIPMLIIGLSFSIPVQYEVPDPLTETEIVAVDSAIDNLSHILNDIENQVVRDQISRTINRLKKTKDRTYVNEELRKLNIEIQKQKSLLPDATEISEAAQTTQHFKDMDTSTLVDELDKLSKQDKIPPKLQDELAKLFSKITENVKHAEQRQALDQTQGKIASPETLEEIVDMLKNIEQLNNLETLLTENRKNIALASIENNQLNGGMANSDNTHGQELGNKEVQGTQEKTANNNWTSSEDDAPVSISEENPEKALVGDDISPIQITESPFKLNSETVSENGNVSRVFTGQDIGEKAEPNYMSFTDVLLSAQRNYSNAIQNNRIPVRFRAQIKAYLEDISKINE